MKQILLYFVNHRDTPYINIKLLTSYKSYYLCLKFKLFRNKT